jgi:pentapeptide MXKDX repeat protein
MSRSTPVTIENCGLTIDSVIRSKKALVDVTADGIGRIRWWWRYKHHRRPEEDQAIPHSIAIKALAATTLGLAIAFAPAAFAADDMKKDTMTKDNMSKDKMDKDNMKKDSMKNDDRKK